MVIDTNTVVVDNDFLSHFAETRLPEETIVKDLGLLFSGLKRYAAIHPLVYQHEVMKSNKTIALFFEKGIIAIPNIEDIYQNDSEKMAYYLFLFSELYRSFFGSAITVSNEKFFSFWKKDSSLGEIHSLTTCLVCGCSMFLSDDADSKKIAKIITDKDMGGIQVFNREEVFKELPATAKAAIPRIERHSLSHVRCG